MTSVPAITLNDGAQIPQLGFGVFQIDPDETAQAVRTALEIGYRHIDTAEMYQNERGVGEGIRDAGLDRAEVYITSKLNNGYHKPDDARRAFDATLRSSAPTMSTCSSSTGRCRRSTAATSSRHGKPSRSSRRTDARAASACPTSRSTTWRGWHTKPRPPQL